MRAAGEEFASLWLHVPAKHELILVTSAGGTGFAVKLPTNGPDLPDLFVHRSLPFEVTVMMRTIECNIGARMNN